MKALSAPQLLSDRFDLCDLCDLIVLMSAGLVSAPTQTQAHHRPLARVTQETISMTHRSENTFPQCTAIRNYTLALYSIMIKSFYIVYLNKFKLKCFTI